MVTSFFIAERIRRSNKKAFTTVAQRIGAVSITLGLATLLIAFLVINGFQKNVEAKLTNFQGQLQIFKYSLNPSIEESPISTIKTESILENFATHIQDIRAFAYKTVLLQTPDGAEGVILKGIDINHTQANFDQYMVKGNFLTPGSSKYNQDIVLSFKTAAKLNVKVGDEILIAILQQIPRYRKLNIVGLYATHIDILDEQIALCDLKLIQHLNDWPDNIVGGYDVYLKDEYPSNKLTNKLLDEIGYDLDIKDVKQSYPALFDWLTIMKKDVVIFLILILLVASSNIISIILIQIMERVNMIKLLKIMGAKDTLIYAILLWNNMYLVIKGMWWGNIIGLGLATLQTYFKFLRLDPLYYYIEYIPVVWNFKMILGLNLLVFGLVFLVLSVCIYIIVKSKSLKINF